VHGITAYGIHKHLRGKGVRGEREVRGVEGVEGVEGKCDSVT
jgi:hypothetical protein